MSTYRSNGSHSRAISHGLITSPTYRSGLSVSTKTGADLNSSGGGTSRTPTRQDMTASNKALKEWYNQRQSQQLALASNRSNMSTGRRSARRETQPSEIPSHIVQPLDRNLARNSSAGTRQMDTLKTSSIGTTQGNIIYEHYENRRNTTNPVTNSNSRVQQNGVQPFSVKTSVSDISAYARQIAQQRQHCQSQMDEALARAQQNTSIMDNSVVNGHLYTLYPNGTQSKSTLHHDGSSQYFYQQPQPFICDESQYT